MTLYPVSLLVYTVPLFLSALPVPLSAAVLLVWVPAPGPIPSMPVAAYAVPEAIHTHIRKIDKNDISFMKGVVLRTVITS